VRSAELVEDWGVESHTTGLFSDPLVNTVAITLENVEIVEIGVSNDFAD